MQQTEETIRHVGGQVAPLRVDHTLCKQCGICVALCPRGVLEQDTEGVRIGAVELCNRCRLCELHCPDFAIEVDARMADEVE
jgi:2-oxoglutarate ferredoxin oxidoreductase subunit delta